VPSQVGFEGYLADAFGSPLNGTHTLAFRLYDVAANGTALSGWSSNVYANVPVTDGFPLDANGAWRIAVANATVSNVKIVIWGYGL
jgi:hypothetical protein